jgi:hypothetical protein
LPHLGADAAQHLQAVHPRDAQVQQDQVGERAGVEAGPAELLQGLLAVAGHLHGDGHLLKVPEGAPHEEDVVLVVLHQQDAKLSHHAGRPAGRHRRTPARCAWVARREPAAAAARPTPIGT